MSTIRVPYPADPERRRSIFERAVGHLARHGTYEGTPDGGTFEGRTSIGRIAGRYHAPVGSDALEITLSHKPLLIPTSLVEREVRRFLEHA